MHSNQSGLSNANNASAPHPPVVYVRNSLNTLADQYGGGGQNIYDSLIGVQNPNNNNSSDLAAN